MTSEANQLALEIRDISKRFDATQALDHVSMSLYAGVVHTLLGENAAGNQGEMLLGGQPIRNANAAQAQQYGIAAICQEPMIFPDRNVGDHIHQPSTAGGCG